MLASWQIGRMMRSPTFYAGRSGYAMYLKITPKYFPDGTVFVGVGLTRGRYDSVLAWPFPHRIRLEVRIEEHDDQCQVHPSGISRQSPNKFLQGVLES